MCETHGQQRNSETQKFWVPLQALEGCILWWTQTLLLISSPPPCDTFYHVPSHLPLSKLWLRLLPGSFVTDRFSSPSQSIFTPQTSHPSASFLVQPVLISPSGCPVPVPSPHTQPQYQSSCPASHNSSLPHSSFDLSYLSFQLPPDTRSLSPVSQSLSHPLILV